jgi:hypothetical protein
MLKSPNKQRILQFRNAAYYPDFMTSLVSFSKLKKRGVFWDTENNQLYREIDRSVVCQLQELCSWSASHKLQAGGAAV